MLSPFPRELVKTITCDNGKEFAGWRQIEAALGCRAYFTDAFRAWQKRDERERERAAQAVLLERPQPVEAQSETHRRES